MNSPSQLSRRHNFGRVSTSSERSLQTFPPVRHTDLVRRRGGLISVPAKLASASGGKALSSTQKLTKLLLNVNIERSLGPVQVVTSPDNKVSDLIKAAIEIYVKEKRRPLLKETDPKLFALHYSQFSLQSLKPEETLISLGSRNFFLCSKPSSSANSSCSEETNMAVKSLFPFTKFMDFLL